MKFNLQKKLFAAVAGYSLNAGFILALQLCVHRSHAATVYWDFAPGTANGTSNGGGTTTAPGNWLAAGTWDRGTGNGYQNWADGDDATIAGASALQLTGNVTANTLIIASGKVIIQSDAAANNHILTLTNGGTIASSASVTLGGELANSAGNERSLDVRLGGNINTGATVGGNLDVWSGTILSSTNSTARNIYANVRIGQPQGSTASATFGDSTRTGSLLISGNLSTFGGSRRIDIAANTTVEVAGNLVNNQAGSAASLTVAGDGTLKTAGVSSLFAGNSLVVGSGSQTTTLELTGSGVMSSGTNGTFGNNISLSSVNSTVRFNSTFASADTPGVQNIDGIISGTGKLVQQGAGTLTLTNANTYSGTTTVSGGTLALASSGTTGTGAVMISTTGSLLGTGIVRGSSFVASSGATIYAGNNAATASFGTLRFTPSAGSGSFDFQSGSSVVLGLNPGGAGDLLSFDGLSNGTLIFNGNLQVTASGYAPTSSETFNLLGWSNVGTFVFNSRYQATSYSGYLLGNGDDNLGFDLPDISGTGYGWDIGQFVVNGTISTVLVPEPGRMLLLMVGVCGLILRRRRSGKAG